MRRILIADDDMTSRAVLAAVLRKIGYDPVEVEDGDSAFRLLTEEDSPSIAVLDWVMPGLDGLDVVKAVRELKGDLPPYIIMLTSRGEKSDVVLGLDGGANDYVSKPFDTGELRARIEVGRRMIEMHRALVQSKEALEYQASHDSLTGLLNRGATIERLEEELAHSQARLGDLVVAALDIDNFKHVNDTYGHQTGDDVLMELSRQMDRSCCGRGIVGRMGGEEFLAILRFPHPDEVRPFLDQLRSSIGSSPMGTRSGPVSITVSVGACVAVEGQGLDRLLGLADSALYRAKDLGRNRVEWG
nr:diguanylate cyclase [uncultured Dethiosulfovibrio sp.]